MIRLFGIVALVLIAASGCNKSPVEVSTGIFPITFERYGYFSVPVLEFEANGEKLRFLMDTGVPTFVLEPASTERLGIVFDGTSFVGDGFGGEVEVRNIYDLDVSFRDQSGRASSHVLLRGLERHSAALQEIGLDGAINPSQLARFGCIAIDSPLAQIRVHLYADELGQEGCPEELLDGPQAAETNHQYLGYVGVSSQDNSVALFDTGYSITVIKASLIDGSKFSKERAQTAGGYVKDYSFALASDVEMQLGSSSVSAELVGAPNALPELRTGELEAIVGWDVLSHSTIIVGRDIPPRIYLPGSIHIPSSFSD